MNKNSANVLEVDAGSDSSVELKVPTGEKIELPSEREVNADSEVKVVLSVANVSLLVVLCPREGKKSSQRWPSKSLQLCSLFKEAGDSRSETLMRLKSQMKSSRYYIYNQLTKLYL